jgi:CheY-like chemotaxis protein
VELPLRKQLSRKPFHQMAPLDSTPEFLSGLSNKEKKSGSASYGSSPTNVGSLSESPLNLGSSAIMQQLSTPKPKKYEHYWILIVDDTVVNVKILLQMLKEFHCVTARNGLELVEAAKQLCNHPVNGRRQFDCILTDIQMPQMTGIEAAAEIRKMENLNNFRPVPVVALTANAMSQERDRCTEAGLLFLAKPFSREDVLILLDSVLHMSEKNITTTTGQQPGS